MNTSIGESAWASNRPAASRACRMALMPCKIAWMPSLCYGCSPQRACSLWSGTESEGNKLVLQIGLQANWMHLQAKWCQLQVCKT